MEGGGGPVRDADLHLWPCLLQHVRADECPGVHGPLPREHRLRGRGAVLRSQRIGGHDCCALFAALRPALDPCLWRRAGRLSASGPGPRAQSARALRGAYALWGRSCLLGPGARDHAGGALVLRPPFRGPLHYLHRPVAGGDPADSRGGLPHYPPGPRSFRALARGGVVFGYRAHHGLGRAGPPQRGRGTASCQCEKPEPPTRRGLGLC